MTNLFNVRRLGRLGTGLTAGAIAAAGLVFAGAPAAHAADALLTPVDVNTDATRATGHNDFLADGVHVWTEGATSTDKAAGYFDVHQPLADVGEPTLDWSGTLPAVPGLQLTTDFDGDGDVDGILVGEPAYGGNWWVGSIQDQSVFDAPNTPPTEGGGGGTYNGTLDQWRTAYPNAEVIQAGWSLGSGVHGDGILYGISVGDTDYQFSDEQTETTEVLHPADVVHPDTRATGHNDFRQTSGVRVWTEGNTSTDKADGYFTVDQLIDEVGEPSMKWRANGTSNTLKPGLQLVVDIDGNGSPDGTLVGERSYANGNPLYRENFGLTNWWLTNGSTPGFKALAPSDAGGYGSGWNGTLAEWRDALPANAKVVAAGWSLGSGVKGDGVIESITVGLTTYTFTAKNQAPVAVDASISSVAGGSISFPLPASDADGDPLTYTIEGQPDADGVLEHTFGRRFIGTATFHYTVNDGRGGTDSGIVTVTVKRAPTTSTLDTFPAGTIDTSSNVRIRLTVATTGYISGTSFVVRVDGVKYGTFILDGDGVVWITIGHMSAGQHDFSAVVRKGLYTKGSTAQATIQVQ
jgi:uncharacterized Zn-binding protein involved in type VI secretion